MGGQLLWRVKDKRSLLEGIMESSPHSCTPPHSKTSLEGGRALGRGGRWGGRGGRGGGRVKVRGEKKEGNGEVGMRQWEGVRERWPVAERWGARGENKKVFIKMSMQELTYIRTHHYSWG